MLNLRNWTRVAACVAVVSVFGAAQEPAQSAQVTSCHDFVQAFYTWYTPLTQKNLKEAAFNLAIRQKPTLFGADLLQALKDDAEAQAKTQGDIVGLDFDPFVSSQDAAGHYTVRNVTIADGRCLAEAWSTGRGTKGKTPNVVAELAPHEGSWQFVNFRYPDFKADLVGMLKDLKKERAAEK